MKNKIIILTLLLFGFAALGASQSVLSIDEMNYDSNHHYFDGELISITLVANEGTESVQYVVPASEIEDRTEFKSETDVEIEIDSLETQQVYEVYEVERYDVKTFVTDNTQGFSDLDELSNYAAANCHRGLMGDYYYNRYFSYWDAEYQYEIYCIRSSDQLASTGQLQKDRVDFETIWSVENDDGELAETEISTTDNEDGTSRFLETITGDNVAHVETLGSLATGEDTYEPHEELVAQSNSFNDGFRVISQSRYESYEYIISDGLSDELGKWARGEITAEGLENDIEMKANNAISEYQESPLYDSYIVGNEWSNGELIKDTDRELMLPMFQLRLDSGEDDSAFVTVNRPVGSPEIISTSGAEIEEFQTHPEQIDVLVENVGASEGTFDARIQECESDEFSAGAERSVNLDPNQRAEISLDISFSSTSTDAGDDEIDSSCTVRVEERSDNNIYDMSTVDVTGIQEDQCNPEDRRERIVNGDSIIEECQEDGLSWREVEVCDDDEVAGIEDGELSCVPEEESERGDDTRTLGQCEEELAFGKSYVNPVCEANKMFSEMFDSSMSTADRIITALDALMVFLSAIIGFRLGTSYLYSLSNIEIIEAVPEQPARIVFGLIMSGLTAYAMFAIFSGLIPKLAVLAVMGVLFYFRAKIAPALAIIAQLKG